MASVLFDTWLMLPLALAALLIGAPALSARHAELRRREANATMPAVFRTLSVAMGAGMTLVQAAEYAGARAGGAVGEAFARLALRLRCGVATETALGELSDELHAPGAGLLSTALAISHRTGSPLQGSVPALGGPCRAAGGVRAPPCGEDRASQALWPRRCVPAPCRDESPCSRRYRRISRRGSPRRRVREALFWRRFWMPPRSPSSEDSWARSSDGDGRTSCRPRFGVRGGSVPGRRPGSAARAPSDNRPRGLSKKAGAAYVIGRLSADGRKTRE